MRGDAVAIDDGATDCMGALDSAASAHPGGDPPSGSASVLDAAALVLVSPLRRLLHRLRAGFERAPVGGVDVRHVDVHVGRDAGPALGAVRDHDHAVAEADFSMPHLAGVIGEPTYLAGVERP